MAKKTVTKTLPKKTTTKARARTASPATPLWAPVVNVLKDLGKAPVAKALAKKAPARKATPKRAPATSVKKSVPPRATSTGVKKITPKKASPARAPQVKELPLKKKREAPKKSAPENQPKVEKTRNGARLMTAKFRIDTLEQSFTPHHSWRCPTCWGTLILAADDPRLGTGTAPKCEKCDVWMAPMNPDTAPESAQPPTDDRTGGAIVGGTSPCTCDHSPEEHGRDPHYPGATSCSVPACGCLAYEADPLLMGMGQPPLDDGEDACRPPAEPGEPGAPVAATRPHEEPGAPVTNLSPDEENPGTAMADPGFGEEDSGLCDEDA